MGIVFKEYLDSEEMDQNKRIYCCSECHTHLALYSSLISTAFTGLHGKAFLFQDVVNVFVGQPEDKRMTTGLHTIRDIHCVACGMVVGWKYVKAFESSQRYKEGSLDLDFAQLQNATSAVQEKGQQDEKGNSSGCLDGRSGVVGWCE